MGENETDPVVGLDVGSWHWANGLDLIGFAMTRVKRGEEVSTSVVLRVKRDASDRVTFEVEDREGVRHWVGASQVRIVVKVKGGGAGRLGDVGAGRLGHGEKGVDEDDSA
jgi:Na+/H+-translocating membrane pyrophosphatase